MYEKWSVYSQRFIINATIPHCQPKRFDILICSFAFSSLYFENYLFFSRFSHIFIFPSICRCHSTRLTCFYYNAGMFHQIHIPCTTKLYFTCLLGARNAINWPVCRSVFDNCKFSFFGWKSNNVFMKTRANYLVYQWMAFTEICSRLNRTRNGKNSHSMCSVSRAQCSIFNAQCSVFQIKHAADRSD